MPPTRQDVHIDRALSDFSIGILQDDSAFVAGGIFPLVEVDKMSDRYYVLPPNPFARGDAKPRGANQESAGFTFELSNDNYNVEVYARHTDVDNKLLRNADDPRLIEESAVRLVTDNIRLTHEVAWAQRFFRRGVWGTDVTGVNTTPGAGQFRRWSDYASSDPRRDIKAAIRAVKVKGGLKPNVLALGYDVWQALQDHPTFVDRVKFTSDANISRQIVARMLDIERIVVFEATKATNPVGAAEAYDFVFGRHAFLCYASSNPGPLSPSAGYVFSWRGTNNGRTVAVKVLDKPLHDATRYEAEVNWDHKVTGANLGYFFEEAVDAVPA